MRNLFLLISILGCCSEYQKINTKALKGATVFDGNGKSIESGTILIKDGIITKIGDSRLKIPKKAQVINVTGKFITPGLIDSHIHFAQTGFFDSRPDFLDIRDSIDFDDLQDQIRNHPEIYYEAYLIFFIKLTYWYISIY